MEENPEKVLDRLKSVEKQLRKLNSVTVKLGWQIQTFRRLFQLKHVKSMSISQSEEVSQFSATLRTILILIQTIALGVKDLESQTFGTASDAEKESKQETKK